MSSISPGNSFAKKSAFGWLIPILAALLIGITLRVYFLAQPMRYDEAYTFLKYVNGSWLDVFRYTLPNNHVLHTALVKVVAQASAAPAALRLPAFAAGVLAIPLIYRICRLMGSSNSGVFAALAMAVFPYLVLYATNARGYTMVVVFALVLTWLAYSHHQMPMRIKLVGMAMVAALGMLTMPSFLFPVAGIYLWLTALLLIKHRALKPVLLGFVLPCGVLSALFTAAFYLPVIYATKSIAAITSNEFVRPLPWPEFFRLMPVQLQYTFNDFTRDVPIPALVLLLAFLLMGLARAIKTQRLAAALLLPCMLIGSALALIAQHATPFPRTWIYLIPFVFITADGGFAWLMDRWPGTSLALGGAACAGCALFAVMLAQTNAITRYPDTGVFAQAPAIAAQLAKAMTPSDKLSIKTPEDWPVYFYLWQLHSEIGPQNENKTGREFFVATNAGHPIQLLTSKPTELIFEYQGASIYLGK
ncbi:MAG: glycosyltransferase family 39 protein [Anaerolineae bacterium]